MGLTGVAADLSDLSNTTKVYLTKGTNDGWSGSAAVTPLNYGMRKVRLVATDTDNATTEAFATVRVMAPPHVTSLAVVGTVTRKSDSAITVVCVCDDPDGSIQSVVADLSAIGIPGATSLQPGSSGWTWSGTVNAQVMGEQTLTANVTDNEGLVTPATGKVTVVDASPDGKVDPVVGTLVQGRDCVIKVSCAASDTDGTVSTVTADLSNIGGSNAQNMPFSATDGKYTWSGTVHPLAWGDGYVTFTITDNDGVSRT